MTCFVSRPSGITLAKFQSSQVTIKTNLFAELKAPEKSLHLENRSALTVNVDDSLTSCFTISRSTTSQEAARAVLHEGLQVTLNHFDTYTGIEDKL